MIVRRTGHLIATPILTLPDASIKDVPLFNDTKTLSRSVSHVSAGERQFAGPAGAPRVPSEGSGEAGVAGRAERTARPRREAAAPKPAHTAAGRCRSGRGPEPHERGHIIANVHRPTTTSATITPARPHTTPHSSDRTPQPSAEAGTGRTLTGTPRGPGRAGAAGVVPTIQPKPMVVERPSATREPDRPRASPMTTRGRKTTAQGLKLELASGRSPIPDPKETVWRSSSDAWW